MKEKTERRLYQISSGIIILLVTGLLLYNFIHNQAFNEGKEKGYKEGYSLGLESYEEKIKDSIENNNSFLSNSGLVKCEGFKLPEINFDNLGWARWII
jgi:hypothetical protein